MGNCYSRQFWAQRTIVNRAAACAGSLPGLRTIARPDYPPLPIFPPPIPPPDEDWWDVETLIGCTVIFAYGSNAASYAASKVNLANPGTYDLTPFDAEADWNPAGWIFTEGVSGDYSTMNLLLTNYTRPDHHFNWTVAVRAKIHNTGIVQSSHFLNAGYGDIRLSAHDSPAGNPSYGYNNFHDGITLGSTSDVVSYHVFVIAGWQLYIDGILVTALVGDEQGYTAPPPVGYSQVLQVGGYLWGDGNGQHSAGGSCEIEKVIGIDCILDSEQVQVLTQRMDPLIIPYDDGWWNGEGSIDCRVIFAYSANAVSYTASKINLVNPGLYGMNECDALIPGWDSTAWHIVNTGYDQKGYSKIPILVTGYTRPEGDTNWTIAVRAKATAYTDFEIIPIQAGFGNITVFIYLYPEWIGYMEANHFNTEDIFYDGPSSFDPYSWHVYVLSGHTLYVDGVPVATQIDGTPTGYTGDSPYFSNQIQIGGYLHKNFSTGDDYQQKSGANVDISKVVGINCTLSYEDVRLLTESMGGPTLSHRIFASTAHITITRKTANLTVANGGNPVLSADQALVAITPIEATLTSSGEAGPQWWLPTGISNADCLWAYKAFGAASYADSKTNVNNPGTGTLEETSVGAPNWAAGSGWSWPAGGASPLLAPTVTNSGSAITVVVYCQQTGVGEAVAGSIYKNLSEVIIAPCVYILPQPSPGGGSRFCNGGSTYDNIAYAIGYMSPLGVAGNKAYIDGYDAGITLDAWSDSQTGKFGIGGLCTHHQYMADNVTNEITTVRRILGVVAYKVTLTADQMLELNDNFVAWGY